MSIYCSLLIVQLIVKIKLFLYAFYLPFSLPAVNLEDRNVRLYWITEIANACEKPLLINFRFVKSFRELVIDHRVPWLLENFSSRNRLFKIGCSKIPFPIIYKVTVNMLFITHEVSSELHFGHSISNAVQGNSVSLLNYVNLKIPSDEIGLVYCLVQFLIMYCLTAL